MSKRNVCATTVPRLSNLIHVGLDGDVPNCNSTPKEDMYITLVWRSSMAAALIVVGRWSS